MFLLGLALLICRAISPSKGVRRSASWTVIGLIALISVGWIPQRLMPLLTETDTHLKNEHDKVVIVLLGAGLAHREDGEATIPFYAYARISKTAESYNKCLSTGGQCRILISGGSVQGQPSEASLYGHSLIAMGVPEKAIQLEERSLNTWQNAKFSQSLINDSESVLIITNGLHAKRSQVYFGHFGIEASVVSADHLPVQLNAWQWGMNWFVFEVEVHESEWKNKMRPLAAFLSTP
jgi:uncharacterized SAM-binding protein YcdF (DUF218 family)